MKFSPQARGEEAKLQMASMIDIVFLLLIFFLVGTKFRVPEGELDAFLPDEGGAGQPPPGLVDEIHVTLLVASGGDENPDIPPRVLLYDAPVPGGLRELEKRLTSMGGLKRPGTDTLVGQEVPVIIEVMGEVPYKWVIATLNMCREVPFETVKFATPRPKDEKAKSDGGSQ